MESKEEIKSYNFSTIKFSDLEKMVAIVPKVNDDKFKEWFEFPYSINESEMIVLSELIKKHRRLLASYSEEKLKMRFLSIILNQVDFSTNRVQDWYDISISGFVNGVELKGFADFMVAEGVKVPHKPYFFIQEFKPTQSDKDVEDQLLAEMLIAIELNQSVQIFGSFIVGQFWKFVILEKIANNQYEYFVSEAFDSLKLVDLKQIYVILQAVKHKYCQD